MICLADMVNVFTLNMTYDVPVKLFSFHLILMALFLLAPELPRLADFFVRNRPAAPSRAPELLRTPRANRIALIAQLVYGAWLAGMGIYSSVQMWHQYGGGAPKSPLYGIWNVQQMSIDGVVRSPLLTDYDRWRRVIFDFPEHASFQRMNDSFTGYSAAIDEKKNALILTGNGDKKPKAHLVFHRAGQERLTLTGEMEGHRIAMELARMDRNKLPLVSRGFHWIQEYPFNH